MNAASANLCAFLADTAKRYIIPVYQRPYSWETEQCKQLWQDILDVGQTKEDRHFTGSVVWIQEGGLPPVGPPSVLVVDGQQRLTTVTLLLIALAEYAQEHPSLLLKFKLKSLLGKCYLIDDDYYGDDAYYRLTLSENDRDTLRALENHLVDPERYPEVQSSSRLVENLNFFREQLKKVDPNVVWTGLNRLEIVSISLDQGRDDPQLIFESMNSTGKALSAADLVRNFVLMRQPKAYMNDLYYNHWRKIEGNLGVDYDQVFDDFLYAYLVVKGIFSKKSKDELYSQFKLYATHHGYLKDADTARALLQDMECFSDYYARITRDTEKDPALRERLWRLQQLKTDTLTPLLLSFYDDYYDDGGHPNAAFTHDDFIALLDTLESYAFRRAVCGRPSNGLNKLVPSIIARLNEVQDEGGDYLEAFRAILCTTAGTQSFPTDEEFSDALLSRDVYGFRHCFYLLAQLESSYHRKGLGTGAREYYKIDPATGNACYSIEHLMPQATLTSKNGWKEMLGDNAEDKFEENVHKLGNLSLTPYNSELGDKSLPEKQQLLRDANVHLVLNENADGKTAVSDGRTDGNFMQATIWTVDQISARARKLATRALTIWAYPHVSQAAKVKFAPKKAAKKAAVKVELRDLLRVGLLKPGTELIAYPQTHRWKSTVQSNGRLRLADGTVCATPSAAIDAYRKKENVGGGAVDCWKEWRLSANEEPLDTLRQIYRDTCATEAETLTHNNYWSTFGEICAEDLEFINLLGDPSKKKHHMDWDGVTSTMDFIYQQDFALSAAIKLQEGELAQIQVCISCAPKAYEDVYADLKTYTAMMQEREMKLAQEKEGHGYVQEDTLDGPVHPDGRKYLCLCYPVPQEFAEDTDQICALHKHLLNRAYFALKPHLPEQL